MEIVKVKMENRAKTFYYVMMFLLCEICFYFSLMMLANKMQHCIDNNWSYAMDRICVGPAIIYAMTHTWNHSVVIYHSSRGVNNKRTNKKI